MKILLSGCTGFIGSRLTKELADEAHDIVSLTRRKDHSGLFSAKNVRYAAWDGRDPGPLAAIVDGVDAVVNFAGESIASGRWSDARKRALLASRVGPTAALVGAIATAAVKPRVLVNASAVGYYGNVDEGDVEESRPAGEGFLASLCVEWERAAMKAEASGVRVVVLRIGVVLGGKGSALGRMALPFRLFVGGPIGTGGQWFPWVHVADVAGVARYVLDERQVRGPVNVVAPERVRMREFSSALGAAMGRPSWAPVPGFAVRLILGELAGMVLGGQNVVPSALRKAGYRFRHPGLRDALADALKRNRTEEG